MKLPPGVSPGDFVEAIKQFEEAVGKQWVFTSDEDVALYRDAYSPFLGEPDEIVASAAVAPDSVEQVQSVVRIANRYKIPIYPISTGRNLGYGGSAPVLSGSVVLDLKRMNRILEVNERNAFALVEPGVSYFDLYRHIQEKGLKLWLDVPDPGWGSLVGNSLDHGAGYTPLPFRDHFESHCGMEVVLANGELLRTGMGAVPKAQTWQQFKYGLGPYVDGLFSQSNFGVVTKMGFWLMPQPEAYRVATVWVPKYNDIIPFVDIMARLMNSGTINCHIWIESPAYNGPPDGAREALLAKPDGGSPEEWDRFAQDIRFIRTAIVDPNASDLAGLRPPQLAWLREANRELQKLAAELKVGRSTLLGTVPLDPVLQWREQLITDSDVWARHIANQATVEAFEMIAKSIVDEQAWEQL